MTPLPSARNDDRRGIVEDGRRGSADDGRPGIAGELRESARRIRDLERVRTQLARTLLDVQQACETSRDPDHAQRLISAAVRDLEELDASLFEARTLHSTTESCEALLAS
ncbi:hypothetical protein JOD47_002338 [Arthrobacter tumbae]|nr:hypothetical protein [Arthrobacter tumbae]